MTSTCPTPDELRSLVDGSLSDMEAQPLEIHIDRCEACQQALQELAADGAFWKSAAASLSDEKIVGPGLDRVIETLQHQSREEAEEIGEAIELKLSFIEPATEPGTIGRLRHYDILRVAGRGGMGIVLKAFDRSLRRIVAIKLLAPHLAGNGQARQRFLREGRAAAAICHQHVVTIHAVEESPPFLVMQYVHGETLEARIHRTGSLDVRDAVRIALQIAQGLAAAHAQGVVHRDIKPANILLENGVARVRITDFGLARAVDDASLTQSGVVAGTPQYMAPEQASGDAIDERADLFSLGSVLYTMLAGHAPFRATTAMGVLKRLCDNAPRPIREINPETPDWLVVLINRLHAKRPADRFHHAGEVAALLERGLAAMQSGSAISVPFFPGGNTGAEETESAEQASLEARSTTESSLVQATGTPEASTDTTRDATRAAVEGQSSNDFILDLKRLLPPYPLWLLFAVVALMVTPFVPEAGIMGVAFALIAMLAPRLMPRVTAKLLGDTASPNPATADASTTSAGSMPRTPFLSMGVLRLLGWLLLWILPAFVWARVFFILERRALSGRFSELLAADTDIHVAMGAVFVAWLVIAVFWFRQKLSDGTYRFSSAVRRKGILTSAGLAAIFCACGNGIWESDVYQLGNQRVVLNNPRFPMPADFGKPQSNVRIELEAMNDGIHVIIDSDTGPVGWVPVDGSLEPTLSGRAGTFPWRAMLGQTTFARGEVTLEAGKTAVINVPSPRLIDLVAGRWKPESKPLAPSVDSRESDGKNLEFEFSQETAIIADRTPGSSRRTDLTVQIDESVTPALITLSDGSGEKLAGIIRFEPGPVDSGLPGGSTGMGGSMDRGMGFGGMMGGGGAAPAVPLTDRLLICISEGELLRPWQFESDPDQGISLFELVRSEDPAPLHRSLVLEPLPIGTTSDVVKESVEAWSERLNLPIERRSSIGMDLTLVPPAYIDLPPASGLRDQRFLLPESQTVVYKDSAAAGLSASGEPGGLPPSAQLQSIVSYPFVISRDVISIAQFRQFVSETGYVTDAERGEPLRESQSPAEMPPSKEGEQASESDVAVEQLTTAQPATAAAAVGGWHHNDGSFIWQDGLSWTTPVEEVTTADGGPTSPEESGANRPATVLSLRDATAFCRWLSSRENRQYRLPTVQEWIVAVQLGAVRLPPESDREEYLQYRRWFDTSKSSPLGIRTANQIFGEWTASSELIPGTSDDYHLIVQKDVSDDGLRFDLSHQSIAPPTFRASDVSFRVVAELQTLTTPDEKRPMQR